MLARHGLRLLLGVLVLAALPSPVPAQSAAGPQRPAMAAVLEGAAPSGLAVLPFEDLRAPRQRNWLGAWLQDAVGTALARTGGTGHMQPETAALWQWKLGLTGQQAPTPAQLREIGVLTVVQGSTQRVLGRVRVQLRVTGMGGSLIDGERGQVELNLERMDPDAALAALLDRLSPVLFPREVPVYPPQARRWEDLELFYGALTRPARQLTPAEHAQRMDGLERLALDPALTAPAHREMAQLLLIQALGLGEEDPRRRALLEAGLNHAQVARSADPDDSMAHALKGETHYFLKEDFQARQEANVARLKNPLNGLGWLVLALNAGLSTGQGTEMNQRALAIDPFLLARNRPSGAPAFQMGVLESVLTQAQARRRALRNPAKGEANAAYEEALALFNAGQWDQAEAAARTASDADEYDPRPWLLRYRVLLETVRADEAVPLLRELAAAYPTEVDVRAWLGVAYRRAGIQQEADKAFNGVLEDQPNHPVVLMEQARAAGEEERWDEARGLLRQVLADAPQNEEAWVLLARVLVKVDQREAAVTSLRQAQRLLPNSEAVRRTLLELGQQP